MEFNDLPLTLSAGEAKRITGLSYNRLLELKQMGLLESANFNRKKNRYTRESIRKLLNLGPEGAKVRID
jgi:hypothetical protein|tara:strand:- start:418 stop:624 length:207 start_codon:yes stop_codon:yes gene_type:complete